MQGSCNIFSSHYNADISGFLIPVYSFCILLFSLTCCSSNDAVVRPHNIVRTPEILNIYLH